MIFLKNNFLYNKKARKKSSFLYYKKLAIYGVIIIANIAPKIITTPKNMKYFTKIVRKAHEFIRGMDSTFLFFFFFLFCVYFKYVHTQIFMI